MTTRNWSYVWLFLVISSLVGCNASHQGGVRAQDAEDPTAWSDSPINARSEDTDKGSSGGSKGFLKSTHLPGGWSSEASEIERSLGVGR